MFKKGLNKGKTLHICIDCLVSSFIIDIKYITYICMLTNITSTSFALYNISLLTLSFNPLLWSLKIHSTSCMLLSFPWRLLFWILPIICLIFWVFDNSAAWRLSATTMASYRFIINDKHELMVPALSLGKFLPTGKLRPKS